VVPQIPDQTAADEASLEGLIQAKGYRLAYAPEAVIYNRGPETIREFLIQRRRIYAGHLYVQATTGYRVSTISSLRIASLFLENFLPEITPWDWRRFIWGPVVGGLEVLARLLGSYDYLLRRRNPYRWAIVASTKRRVSAPENLDAPLSKL
jgi:hypothetical protein